MSERRAVFFDIDGTLWDFRNQIPQSTVEAIRRLRQNGTLAFLCSGRTRAYITNPVLLGIGFDGVISGCGTMIEYKEETVLYKRLDTELAEHTVNTVRKYGFRPILEGREFLYMDDCEFEQNVYGKKLKAELGSRLRPIAEEWGRWEISKLSCDTENVAREECFAALEQYYDYIIHNSAVVEMVPRGFHKGTGIVRVCERLDIDISNTYAFGDSVNDREMIETAGVGIVMGNGSDEIKAMADHVTAPLNEDGIWKACRALGLI